MRILFVSVYFFLAMSTFSPVKAQEDFEFFFGSTAKYQDVLVEEVVSADTIIIEGRETIKLIGLKAPIPPEILKKKKLKRDEFGFIIKEPVNAETSSEERAYNFSRNLLEGKRVRLEFDVNRKNEDFLTLAYVFLAEDNIFANAEILRNGFANLQLRPPNNKYSKQLREAYKTAREEKRGMQGEY